MKPRICMLIERYAPLVGGSERQCQLLVRGLRQKQYPVFVVTRRVHAHLPGEETIDGVSVYRLAPSGIGRVWFELGFACTAAAELIRRRSNFDILHLHSGTSIAGAIAILTAKALGKKTFVKVATAGDVRKGVIEGADGRQTAPSAFHRIVNAFVNGMLRRADRIHAISGEIGRELEEHGFAKDRIVSIPNAVDTELFAPVTSTERNALRAQLHFPAHRALVLFTGRLIHRKGIDILLRAWQELRALHDKAFLIVVGSGDSSIDSVEALLRSRGKGQDLKESVRFVGEQQDVLPYLQCADLFVFPSRREGLSNALLEALSCGLPTIATSIGGNVDVLTHEKDGLLVPTDDPGALAQALSSLLTDDGRRAQLGARARQSIEQRFSLKVLLPHYCNLYDSLAHA